MKKTNTETMRKARTGITMARTESTVLETDSPVETAGLATPPVVTVDAPRTTVVSPWTTAALPPPAMNATDQVITGLRSDTADAVHRVPAITAAGRAMVSSMLSTQGR